MRILFLFAATAALHANDFPQWRGPSRNGVIQDSPKLYDKLPEGGLRELWESEAIPTNDEGGLASPVVAGGKVFVALVWHRDVPAETRQIDELVLRQLGFQPTSALGAELVKKVEAARDDLPPGLRGKKLDEFTESFVAANFDKKQRQLYHGWVSKRFAKGKFAMPLEVLETLDKHKEHVFSTEAEMKSWLDEQISAAEVKAEIIKAVPPTKRVAEDAVIALDLATGKTLWKTTRPGMPVGRGASATPCVANGKVFAVGSERVWCVDAADGKVIWETPLKKKSSGSSPMVVDGVLVANIDKLTGFDAQTGKQLWQADKAGGGNASPVLWESGGKKFILCNGRDLAAVELTTGALAWSVPAGGDSTPALDGDIAIAQTRKPELGLVAYKLTPEKAEQAWNFPLPAEVLRTQSSPLIHAGRVYLLDDNTHHCLDAKTGAKIWIAPAQSTISSPVLADGKLFAMANNGNTLVMLAVGTPDYTELGKATVRSQWIPSPCIAAGKLVLRMNNKVKAWSLTP